MYEWQVKLADSDVAMQTDMYLFRESPYAGIEYAHFENGHLMLTEAKRTERIKPFLTLSGMMAREFFLALGKALDEKGFRPDSAAKIEGTLKATQYHLEDLRKMLKLKKD